MFSFFRRGTPRNDAAFGIAVLGTGRVARKFMESVAGSPSVHVSALVTRDPAGAAPLAKKFGVPHIVALHNFAQMEDLSSTQAVYVALPNALHREYAERAAALGLHVLCEKPLAATIADAQAMIDVCRAANVQLSPGYRFLFDPAYLRLRRLVQEEALGRLTHIESNFGFVLQPDWRLDPAAAGGGSLFDVGVYPLRAFADLFPAAELRLTSVNLQRDPATQLELDTQFTATLAGTPVTCRSSYIADVANEIKLTGERGTLTLHHAFDYTGCRLEADYSDAAKLPVRFTQKPQPRAPHTFRLEAEAFAAAVRSGAAPRSTGEDGLADMQTIAAIEAFGRV
jgi:predicted dehydrogenase